MKKMKKMKKERKSETVSKKENQYININLKLPLIGKEYLFFALTVLWRERERERERISMEEGAQCPPATANI